MLNITEITPQVNQAPIPNTLNLAGRSIAYKQLKALGWQATGDVHHRDRVSTFALGPATLRIHAAKNRVYLVEFNGTDYEFSGSPSDVTDATRLLLEPEAWPAPAPLTPAESIGQDLTAEFPQHAARVEAAVALANADDYGYISHYSTRYLPAVDVYACDCPDSEFRNPQARWGTACKHATALYIRDEIQRQIEAAGLRKMSDRPRPAATGLSGISLSPAAQQQAAAMLQRTRQQVEASGQRTANATRPDDRRGHQTWKQRPAWVR